MKIRVTGKADSGKSVIAVLLAKLLTLKGYSVLLVDTDEADVGLRRMLGMNTEPVTLMEYLGSKRAIQQKNDRCLSEWARRAQNGGSAPARHLCGRYTAGIHKPKLAVSKSSGSARSNSGWRKY
jgi:CO dehydrogenase nickel-insertion accessory protein CooC1